MRAVMLAAGVGRRLGGEHGHPPKVLLSFGGKTLLRRHVEILSRLGFEELTIATGYQAEEIEEELDAIDPPIPVRTLYNPEYRLGSVISLWTVRRALMGGDVVLMDGDVLYDHRLMARLLAAGRANCFAMDRQVEAGGEPVKICLSGESLVDFHKTPQAQYDDCGEWVGLLRLSRRGAMRIVAAAKVYIEAGERGTMYEEAIRDALLARPGLFAVADITGLPWIEIDFADDVRKAREEVLPLLQEPLVQEPEP